MSDESRSIPRMDDDGHEGKIVLSDPGWDTPVAPEESATPNPLLIVLNRMHGRWLWAIVLAAILAPTLAVFGYLVGPVKYGANAVLLVQSRLETLVEETPETAQISVREEVAEQAQLIQDPQVLYRAMGDQALDKYKADRPGLGATIANNIKVSVPRNSALFIVRLEDRDPRFAADAVNAVVQAYVDLYAPDTQREFTDKLDKINTRIAASRRLIEELKKQRIDLLRDSQYAITDVQAIIATNVEGIRRLEAQLSELDLEISKIEELVAVREQTQAESESREVDPENLKPGPNDRVPPSIAQLTSIDPELASLELNLNKIQVAFGLTAARFGTGHQQYRTAKANMEAQRRNFEERMILAEQSWLAGEGKNFTWAVLGERRKTLEKNLEQLRSNNTELALDMITAEDLQGKIEREEDELALLEDRAQGLDRERENIRKGRVELRSSAVPAISPTNNKKLPAAAAGAFGGLAIGFGLFFVLGTIDQKTFGVRQLQDPQYSLRVLGVMPNMDEIAEESTTVTLATDCVHRIRSRIESRRSPEHGYAMMVSSPFQGDGKTTLAVSLGWSYAESGYKTLLLDADFIGRAMTHQFGHLRDPGLREIIRKGEIGDEIHELGHPNLCLLGVGFDRRISAANLSPRLMSRVLDAVRDRFDVIIVDSGPLTASIEALPVASAVDGVVLALRRGRSRGRLAECIQDVRAAGADYLGVVLNYADRADCLRHGSTSRMSASVQAALDEGDASALPDSRNPLLGDLRTRDD